MWLGNCCKGRIFQRSPDSKNGCQSWLEPRMTSPSSKICQHQAQDHFSTQSQAFLKPPSHPNYAVAVFHRFLGDCLKHKALHPFGKSGFGQGGRSFLHWLGSPSSDCWFERCKIFPFAKGEGFNYSQCLAWKGRAKVKERRFQ